MPTRGSKSCSAFPIPEKSPQTGRRQLPATWRIGPPRPDPGGRPGGGRRPGSRSGARRVTRGRG
eukprot:5615834-Lingulodinium_polyedra.AAC.1